MGVQEWEASHVYNMRDGAVIRPLDAMYGGPYRMLVREREQLLLEIYRGLSMWVSVDRLKLHTGAETPPCSGAATPTSP